MGPEVIRQAEDNQPTQPNLNPIYRRVRPVVSGQPTRSYTQFEEVDIDLGVSGLPYAVVRQAENSRVRELVKKIASSTRSSSRSTTQKCLQPI